jgi:hypothetical protein
LLKGASNARRRLNLELVRLHSLFYTQS